MKSSKDHDLFAEGAFINSMEGGAFVFTADKKMRLLHVNDNLVRMFDCEDADEFMTFTGGTFPGMIHDPEASLICKEIEIQLNSSSNGSGYVFYNIRATRGNVRRVVNHWTLVHDRDTGDVFYATLYLHRLDNSSGDFDLLTGLLNKRKFDSYATKLNKQCITGGRNIPFAVVYINLTNFKLFNIEHGANEGNACLKALAKALGQAYDGSFISRLADDRFAVFTEYRNVHEQTENAIKKFDDSYGDRNNIICIFGIYKFSPGPDFYIETALSCAKIACDYAKSTDNIRVAEYDEELAKNVFTREYVITRIDDAIKNGWIKVYFQPVVRSLTEDACSMESLVRWIDPEIGFLPPDRFISVLEEAHSIHKLDCYVIDRVCELIGQRLRAGLPTVPASVNLSRLDFVMCDMLSVVEEAVRKHNIPKEYIHIEITESMIASDEDLMRRTIQAFKDAGYEIWMDDFGSGYSSLTMLKDYEFNTIKLDMRFLTPFTDKSKSIIKSVVMMAKDVGMKTLAEGVETKEQLDFLHDIGCGLIQGYYYGKPEPIEEVFRHLSENGINDEKIEWSSFYQAASFNARSTEVPLELIEDDGKTFRTLFMNKAYRDQIFSGDFSLEEIDGILYRSSSPLMKKYREFADIAEMSGQKETFYYTEAGNYICLTVQSIAEHKGRHILMASIMNLSRAEKSDERERLDTMLKEMNLLFESVQAVNLSENTIVPLLGGFRYLDREAVDGKDLQKSIRYFAENMVHPDETQRCLDFLASPTLASRVNDTKLGYVADVFRIKKEDGYRLCETYIMMIPGTGENEYLFCVKECVSQGS